MDQIPEYVDERLNSWCIHCGTPISTVDSNKDHVPSKALLEKPYPDNLPTVLICAGCNNGFSRDEEYMAVFLQCVLKGTADPDLHGDTRSGRALRKDQKLRAKIELSRAENTTVPDDIISMWQPDCESIGNYIR